MTKNLLHWFQGFLYLACEVYLDHVETQWCSDQWPGAEPGVTGGRSGTGRHVTVQLELNIQLLWECSLQDDNILAILKTIVQLRVLIKDNHRQYLSVLDLHSKKTHSGRHRLVVITS